MYKIPLRRSVGLVWLPLMMVPPTQGDDDGVGVGSGVFIGVCFFHDSKSVCWCSRALINPTQAT